jgi:hypothetical protein
METEVVESIFLAILRDSVGTGLQPMPGAVEVLGELSGRAPVTIITARPEAEPVHRWLEEMFPAGVRQRLRVVAMGDHTTRPGTSARPGSRPSLTTGPRPACS